MVGGVLLCIGFLIVAGAVGGIDGDTIDLLPGALQIMIGFILSGVGIEYGELFNPPVMEIENLKQGDTNETEKYLRSERKHIPEILIRLAMKI